MNKLGDKIRYFRKRAKMSQLDLEVAIGTSPGAISRIENGEVNPTKDTIDKVSESLSLNTLERLFLDGDYSREVTIEEVSRVVKENDSLLKSNSVFAYICDERFKVWAFSEGFRNLLGFSKDFVQSSLCGNNLLELIFDDSFKIKQFFNEKKFRDIAIFQVNRFKKQLPFWECDEYLRSLLNRLMEMPLFKEIWQLPEDQSLDLYSNYSRVINFVVNGLEVDMEYSREPIRSCPRMNVVFYRPDERFLLLVNRNKE